MNDPASQNAVAWIPSTDPQNHISSGANTYQPSYDPAIGVIPTEPSFAYIAPGQYGPPNSAAATIPQPLVYPRQTATWSNHYHLQAGADILNIIGSGQVVNVLPNDWAKWFSLLTDCHADPRNRESLTNFLEPFFQVYFPSQVFDYWDYNVPEPSPLTLGHFIRALPDHLWSLQFSRDHSHDPQFDGRWDDMQIRDALWCMWYLGEDPYEAQVDTNREFFPQTICLIKKRFPHRLLSQIERYLRDNLVLVIRPKYYCAYIHPDPAVRIKNAYQPPTQPDHVSAPPAVEQISMPSTHDSWVPSLNTPQTQLVGFEGPSGTIHENVSSQAFLRAQPPAHFVPAPDIDASYTRLVEANTLNGASHRIVSAPAIMRSQPDSDGLNGGIRHPVDSPSGGRNSPLNPRSPPFLPSNGANHGNVSSPPQFLPTQPSSDGTTGSSPHASDSSSGGINAPLEIESLPTERSDLISDHDHQNEELRMSFWWIPRVSLAGYEMSSNI
ncbi:uncharacterized protein I303_101726 [Kwoniella dejecticola CBS 10117]|uniref:Uncharacterized protein n=1 Tax=Kwoniella dejecticola CBS 10117 TaxID=1296121 RepID=A0A1A6AD00_9TREE|nr:uncharacterized protein I303_02138 [Kwoniella dejecticola CBS 10117]OBR87923.1 hypothetical protein I303_02138 [Kwoniella dejecticola CBS 10117]